MTDARLPGLEADPEGVVIEFEAAPLVRSLPWELMAPANGAHLLLNAYPSWSLVRVIGGQPAAPRTPADRRLQILFTASAPEGGGAPLAYEAEEWAVYQATAKLNAELVVEDSGSPEGLNDRLEEYGRSYFDIFHLSGHASATTIGPVFAMEDDQGRVKLVGPAGLRNVFANRFPPLVFLSGCETGLAAGGGAIRSFAEELVGAGAPVVLGWDLPVGDASATALAASLYGHLAEGRSILDAVALARAELAAGNSPAWHQLRHYSSAGASAALVTEGRKKPLTYQPANTVFLAANVKKEVCAREDFIGRRRDIQKALRALRSGQYDADYADGVLVHGTGGLGKTSLAVRLCERLSGHERVVNVGSLDQIGFLGRLNESLKDANVTAVMEGPGSLEQRLTSLFRRPLADTRVLFVFDDFEQAMEQGAGGSQLVQAPAIAVLKALAGAIRSTNSDSRMLITCRYAFSIPGASLTHIPLTSFTGADLERKRERMAGLQDAEEDIRERAHEAAGGNPRLLQWLNDIAVVPGLDREAVFAAMASEEERFREEAGLKSVIEQQGAELKRLAALVGLADVPIPREAVVEMAGDEMDVAPQLERAIALGLVEVGPYHDEQRFSVAPVVRDLPQVARSLMDHEWAAKTGRLAAFLFARWWEGGEAYYEDEAREIHRLSLAATDPATANRITAELATTWVNRSRFQEARALCLETLKATGASASGSVLNALARAESVLGDVLSALTHYSQAEASFSERDDEQSVVAPRSSNAQ